MGIDIMEQCFECSSNNTKRLPNGDLFCNECRIEFSCGGSKE